MNTELGLELDHLALEVETFHALDKSLSDLLKLLSDDGKHLDINTVELIETSPATLLGETSEMTLHHLVINLIGTVVDDTKDGNSFSQILGRLSLTGSGRARWVCTELDMKGTSNGNPALVSQGGNDETGTGTHVLVTVIKHGLNLANDTLGFLLTVNLLVGVTELLLPVEIILTRTVLSSELIDDITGMDILSDQGLDDFTLEVSQLTTDNLGKFLKPFIVGLEPLVKGIRVILHGVDGFLSGSAPLDHIDSDNNLSWLVFDPSFSVIVTSREVLVTLLEGGCQCGSHIFLDLVKPFFNFSLMFDWSLEGNTFAFTREHMGRLVGFGELEVDKTIEKLLEESKDRERLTLFGENFEELVIRQEAEAREVTSLGLQESGKLLHDVVN